MGIFDACVLFYLVRILVESSYIYVSNVFYDPIAQQIVTHFKF